MSKNRLFAEVAADAFQRAVAATEGGQSGLAKLIGKSQGAVSKRLASSKPLWAETVLAVEAATGVSRHDLRPDLYPREESPRAPAGAGGLDAGGSSSSLEEVRS